QRLGQELAAAMDQLATYQRRLQRWQTRWNELTEPLADSQQVPPDAINVIIRTVDDCHNLRRQRDSASEKIARCRRRRDDYLERVRHVATELAVPLSSARYGDDVRELAQRLETQEQRAAEHRLLCDQIENLHTE